MVESFLAPKWPILVPFCGMDHKKSNFLLISDTLSIGGCWGQLMLLFWKLVDETQMGNPCDHAARDILSKLSILLPLRAVYFRSYQYETPCTSAIMNAIAVNMQEDYNNARDSKLTIKIDLSKLLKSSKNYFFGLSSHRKFNLILAKYLVF